MKPSERPIRKLTAIEKYRMAEMFKANRWKFDERGDYTSFTPEELERFFNGESPFTKTEREAR